jgi:uncharacterized damage-inducible protein DinB
MKQSRKEWLERIEEYISRTRRDLEQMEQSVFEKGGVTTKAMDRRIAELKQDLKDGITSRNEVYYWESLDEIALSNTKI